jgi:disulfide bond formation protein DsbB
VNIPNKRILNLVGLVACIAMMGFALFAQYVLLLDPCPLCVLQRIAVIGLGIVFLIAALHNAQNWGGRVYAGLVALIAAAGIGVASWHVHLQNLPPDEVPACGSGLNYMLDNFPLADALKMVFEGSGECAEVVWRFLGLSMPTWVVVILLVTGVCGVWNNIRREH